MQTRHTPLPPLDDTSFIENDGKHPFSSSFLAKRRLFCITFYILIFSPPAILLRKFKSPWLYPFLQFGFRCGCRALGISVTTEGTVLNKEKGPVLFFANHSSYFDIFVIGSRVRGSFVAKAEIESWPIFGFLTKLPNSIFVVRDRQKAAEQTKQIQDRLKKNAHLILFPEGTTSDGRQVLPFLSSLFQTAKEERVKIQPISITYHGIDGMPMSYIHHPFYAWFGDMSLLPHLIKAVGIGKVNVHVTYHPPVTYDQFANRKELAAHCEQVVREGVIRKLQGKPSSS